MKLDKFQALDILRTIWCDDDYVISRYGHSIKKVIKNSKQHFASKILIKYWFHNRLKKGSLFTLVQDRLATKSLYRRRK